MRETLIFGSILLFNIPSVAFSEGSQQDQAILNQWQQQSGQSGRVVSRQDGAEIEWHGQITEDIYNVDTSTENNNSTLSGLQEGTFTLTNLQGDLRSVTQEGDITYVQGGVEASAPKVIRNDSPKPADPVKPIKQIKPMAI